MRRTLAVGVLLVVGAVLAAPAFAAPPTPTEKKLQAEITVLQNKIPAMQKQVTTLQKQVKTLTNVLSAEIDYSICSNAVTADALQQTWATVNISSTGAIFGAAESPVNDIGSCTSWKVTRAAAGVPNLAVFKALIALWS
jgi:uncharacterized protein YlxW (UPF0749 family)